MFARVVELRAPPEGIDAAARFFREEVVPGFSAHDGALELALLADREAGVVMALGLYEDRGKAEAAGARGELHRRLGEEISAGRVVRSATMEVLAMHRRPD